MLYEELIRMGFILTKRYGGEVLRLDPALTIERKYIDGFISELELLLIYKNHKVNLKDNKLKQWKNL